MPLLKNSKNLPLRGGGRRHRTPYQYRDWIQKNLDRQQRQRDARISLPYRFKRFIKYHIARQWFRQIDNIFGHFYMRPRRTYTNWKYWWLLRKLPQIEKKLIQIFEKLMRWKRILRKKRSLHLFLMRKRIRKVINKIFK